MNPTLHTAALAALETAINRALKLDPATTRNLGQLDGKVFRLEIAGTGADIYLLPEQHGLQLQGFYDGPIDSHVIGTMADFVELISADDAASTLINGGIKLSGDSAPLLQLQGILHRLELDWEGSLARVIGDVPAHQLGKMVRGGMHWGQQAFTSINRQAEEFLHEEARLLPPAAELQDFYDAIASTGLALDRVEARLQRQQQRLQQLQQRRTAERDN